MLFILDALFGGKAVAVKVFVILILIGTVVWILYKFNFSLPKINIKLAEDEKSTARSTTRKPKIERDENGNLKPQTIDQ